MIDEHRGLVIWHFSDGKPGHENQSLGLIDAIQRRVAAETHPLVAGNFRLFDLVWQRGVFREIPAPDLIIGAGHRTHLLILAARTVYGGRSVVLMKPSLPIGLFDLCLIPKHDGVPESPRVIVTLGALNRVTPGTGHRPDQGLILVGGPSKYFRYNNPQLQQQLNTLLAKQTAIQWLVTNSRRTTKETTTMLASLDHPNLDFVPHEQTGPGWVKDTLKGAGTVWVTEDSVSMVYEALSSGAAVGLIRVKTHRNNRIAQGLNQLIEGQWLTDFDAWLAGNPVVARKPPLSEATRCADLLLQRWSLL